MEIVSISIVMLLGLVSPGPDFFFIAQAALKDEKAALLSALGISMAVAVWASLAIIGQSILFHSYPSIIQMLKLCGVLYMLYIGAITLNDGIQRILKNYSNDSIASEKSATPDDSKIARRPTPQIVHVLSGTLFGLFNPKSLVFFQPFHCNPSRRLIGLYKNRYC